MIKPRPGYRNVFVLPIAMPALKRALGDEAKRRNESTRFVVAVILNEKGEVGYFGWHFRRDGHATLAGNLPALIGWDKCENAHADDDLSFVINPFALKELERLRLALEAKYD